MQDDDVKAGIHSWLVVLKLILEALVDLAALPFRLFVFLVRRKKICNDILRLLRGVGREQS